MEGRFWRDASGRLTFDTSSVQAEDYPAVCRSVADAFGLTSAAPLVVGPEQMFWEFQLGEQAVGLDWDIWMGFMIVARAGGAEPLVRGIAAWLSSSQWAGGSKTA